jgi:6-phosphogluconolactonase
MTSGRQTIVRVATPAALADEAARRFAEAARAAITSRERFVVALSGGSTPAATYRRLADPAGPGTDLDWRNVHVFWGDERDVPPRDSRSNYRMAREALLDHVAIPGDQIHRVPTELPADEAASAYERTLRHVFGAVGDDVPIFDLVLLGMGEEGHTASLFPGSPAVADRQRLVAAPWVEKFGEYRITLTPPVLQAARRLLVLVSGAGKADALHEALEGPVDPRMRPVQLTREAVGDVLWLVDDAAASRLDRAGA